MNDAAANLSMIEVEEEHASNRDRDRAGADFARIDFRDTCLECFPDSTDF